MDYSNEVLEKIENKRQLNLQYSKWYYGMSQEFLEHKNYSKKLYNRSERINDCLDLWLWDKYNVNKLLDLKKVNRCKNNRFCPNCRKLDLGRAIHNFSPVFKKMLDDGYYPYMITLTIPNCLAEELRFKIDDLNNYFRKFFNAFSYPLEGVTKQGFKQREIVFDGALKVLEITHNFENNSYHPHFHIIAFSKQYDESLFQKNIEGAWSNKRNCQMYNSFLDIHLMKVWTMIVNNIRLTKKNYNSMSENWYDLYMCDIRELDQNGIYEVLKYTFKDSDIVNYSVFKTLVISLDDKRIRQGYGLLYNLKLENESDSEKQSLDEFLIVDKKESPDEILVKEINTLIIDYNNFKKISRFNSDRYLNLVND